MAKHIVLRLPSRQATIRYEVSAKKSGTPRPKVLTRPLALDLTSLSDASRSFRAGTLGGSTLPWFAGRLNSSEPRPQISRHDRYHFFEGFEPLNPALDFLSRLILRISGLWLISIADYDADDRKFKSMVDACSLSKRDPVHGPVPCRLSRFSECVPDQYSRRVVHAIGEL